MTSRLIPSTPRATRNIIATALAVLALASTAWAASLPHNSVGSAQVKNNTIGTIDISSAGRAGIHGAAGPAGIPGAQGLAGRAAMDYTWTSASFDVTPGAGRRGWSSCPADYDAISGGVFAQAGDRDSIVLGPSYSQESVDPGTYGWIQVLTNNSAGTINVSVYAQCVKGIR